MQSFMKTKPPGNGEISLSFTGLGKSYALVADFNVANMSFKVISENKLPRKYLNLQYTAVFSIKLIEISHVYDNDALANWQEKRIHLI